MPDLLPTVKLGDHEITRLIIGGNPISGNSHQSPQMDAEFADYYTNINIVRAFLECEKQGLNAMQLRGDRHIRRAINEYRNSSGTMHWIAQIASELRDLHGHVRQLANDGAIAIYHHGSRTDNMWRDGTIDQVQELLATMRETGVQVGLCSHLPEVIEYCEENEWDVDFYMTSFYTLGSGRRESKLVSGETTHERYDAADRDAMCRVIRATSKPCLAFKILAADRNCDTPQDTREAFEYAFANIKPTDAVVVGMFQKSMNQIERNARIVREIHARAAASPPNQQRVARQP